MGVLRAPFRAVRTAAVSVVILALIASCGSPKSHSATAKVRARAETTLRKDDVGLTVPAGGAYDGAKLTLNVANSAPPDAPLSGLRFLGKYANVTLPGTLTKPATLTFRAPPELTSDGLPPIVVWQDIAGGWRWLPTQWRPGDPVVSATTDHFSGGFLAGFDVHQWAQKRAADFKAYISGRHNVAQPSCGDEAAARPSGVSVVSDSGDRVKWCYGLDNGTRLLKIANNTRTFMQVTYPSTWSVVDTSAPSISNDALARAVGMVGRTAPGTATRIVDGGDTLSFAVPAGISGRATAEMSVTAWLASALEFLAQGYAAVASLAGSAFKEAAATALVRLRALLLEGETGNVETKSLWKCMHDARDLTDMSEKVAVDVLKFAWKCGPDLMKAEMQGVKALAASQILSLIGTVVGLGFSAANVIVSGFREVWDGIASFAGHSDNVYDIVIKSPPAVLIGICGDRGQPGHPLTQTIDFGCDDIVSLANMTWKADTTDSTSGTGEATYRNCPPDCAGGGTTTVPVQVLLQGQAKCRSGTQWWTYITVIFPAELPPPIANQSQPSYYKGVRQITYWGLPKDTTYDPQGHWSC